MSVRRSSWGSRSLRLLVPAVLVASVVLVPGVASAEDGNPLAPVTDAVQGAVDRAAGGSSTGRGTGQGSTGTDPLPLPGLPGGSPSQLAGGLPGTGTGGDAPSPGDPSTGLSPDALRALLIQTLEPLGVSEDCVNGVFDGFQNVVVALSHSGPQDLQGLLNQLVGALQNGGQGFDPSSLSDSDLSQALQGLATALQEKCMPAPPPTTPPVSGGDHQSPPPSTPAVAAPVAAPAVQQPVSYLGYAPTGGAPAGSTSPVPLAALAGVVLLSGAGAAGYRVSTRAARSRG